MLKKIWLLAKKINGGKSVTLRQHKCVYIGTYASIYADAHTCMGPVCAQMEKVQVHVAKC